MILGAHLPEVTKMTSTIANKGYYNKRLRDGVDQIYIASVDCLPCFSGAPAVKCHQETAASLGCTTHGYIDYAFTTSAGYVTNYYPQRESYYNQGAVLPDEPCFGQSQFSPSAFLVPLGQRHEIDQTDLSGYIAGTPFCKDVPTWVQTYFEDAFRIWGNLINSTYRYCGHENSLQVDFVNKGMDYRKEPICYSYPDPENIYSCIEDCSIVLDPGYSPAPPLSMDLRQPYPTSDAECKLDLPPNVRIAMVRGLDPGEFAAGVSHGIRNFDSAGNVVYGVCNLPKPELEGDRESHSSIILNCSNWGHLSAGAYIPDTPHTLRKIAMQLVGNALGFKAATSGEHSIMSPSYITAKTTPVGQVSQLTVSLGNLDAGSTYSVTINGTTYSVTVGPSATTELSADLSKYGTIIKVDSVAGFPQGGLVKITEKLEDGLPVGGSPDETIWIDSAAIGDWTWSNPPGGWVPGTPELRAGWGTSTDAGYPYSSWYGRGWGSTNGSAATSHPAGYTVYYEEISLNASLAEVTTLLVDKINNGTSEGVTASSTGAGNITLTSNFDASSCPPVAPTTFTTSGTTDDTGGSIIDHGVTTPAVGCADSDIFAQDFPHGLDKDVDGKAFLELYGECRNVPGEMEQMPPPANCKSKWDFTNMAPCNSESYNWLASRINAVTKIKPYKFNDYYPFRSITEFVGRGRAIGDVGGATNTFNFEDGSDHYIPERNTPLIPKDCYSFGDDYEGELVTSDAWGQPSQGWWAAHATWSETYGEDGGWWDGNEYLRNLQSSRGANNNQKKLFQALGVPIYGANDLPSMDGAGSPILGDLYSEILNKDYNSIDIKSRVYDVTVEPIRNEASPYLANLGYLDSPWPGLIREVPGSFSFAPCRNSGYSSYAPEHIGFVRTKLEALFTQETTFELKRTVGEIIDPWGYDKGRRSLLDKTSMLAYLPETAVGSDTQSYPYYIGNGEGNDYSYKFVWHDNFCGAPDLTVNTVDGHHSSVDHQYRLMQEETRCSPSSASPGFNILTSGRFGYSPCCSWKMGSYLGVESAFHMAGSLTKKALLIQNNLYGDPIGGGTPLYRGGPRSSNTGFWWVKTSEVQAAVEATGFYFDFKRVSVPYKLQGFDISYSTEPVCYVRESGDIHDLTGYVSYSLNNDGTLKDIKTNRVQPEQSFQDYIKTGVSIGGLRWGSSASSVGNPIQPLRRDLNAEDAWSLIVPGGYGNNPPAVGGWIPPEGHHHRLQPRQWQGAGTMTYTWVETNNSYNNDIRAGRWFNNFNTIFWTPEIDPLDEGFLYFEESGVISTAGVGITDPVFEFEVTGYFPFLNRIETFVYADSEAETTWVLPLDPNYHSYVNRQPDVSDLKMYKPDFVKTQSVTNGRKLITKSDTTGLDFFANRGGYKPYHWDPPGWEPVNAGGTGFNLILDVDTYSRSPYFAHADGHNGPCSDVISSRNEYDSNYLFQRSVRGIDEGVMYIPEKPPWPSRVPILSGPDAATVEVNHLKLKWHNMLYAYDSQPVFETTVGDKYKEIFLASRLNLFPKDLYVEYYQSAPAAGLSASRNNKTYVISHYESDLKYLPFGAGTNDFHPGYPTSYNSATADGSIISHLDMQIQSHDPWHAYWEKPTDLVDSLTNPVDQKTMRYRLAPSQLLSMDSGVFLPDHTSGPTDAGFWDAPGTNLPVAGPVASFPPLVWAGAEGVAGFGKALTSRSMVESPLTPSVDTNYFPRVEVPISGYQIQNILVGTTNSFYLQGTSFLGGGQKAAINIHWDDFVDV